MKTLKSIGLRILSGLIALVIICLGIAVFILLCRSLYNYPEVVLITTFSVIAFLVFAHLTKAIYQYFE